MKTRNLLILAGITAIVLLVAFTVFIIDYSSQLN